MKRGGHLLRDEVLVHGFFDDHNGVRHKWWRQVLSIDLHELSMILELDVCLVHI